MSNYYKINVQYYCFLIFLNTIYNTYRDLQTRIILNKTLRIALDNATYTKLMKLFSVILIYLM